MRTLYQLLYDVDAVLQTAHVPYFAVGDTLKGALTPNINGILSTATRVELGIAATKFGRTIQNLRGRFREIGYGLRWWGAAGRSVGSSRPRPIVALSAFFH